MSKISSPFLPALICDIGGTNARFQIVANKGEDPQKFETIPTAKFESIETAIEKTVLDKTRLVPKTAIIAAAGPITKDGLNLTNCHWDIQALQFLNNTLFTDLVLMNDFEAQALSLPYLTADDLSPLGKRLPGCSDNHTKVVLGPGTGLGVGLLVRAANQWVPVAGEGGHVDLGPRGDREIQVWKHLETVEGRVSAEQVLSGDGLVNLYQACCAADQISSTLVHPHEVSLAACEGTNNQAHEALSIFCACLGRVAGDVAITTGAKGGVYIAGGIAKKILGFLQASTFRTCFEDKAPNVNLMREMATNVVMHDLPALIGLAAFARNPDDFLMDIDPRHWSK
ncbi:MAG: glucokinase [Rhizobiaceae bacterium]